VPANATLTLAGDLDRAAREAAGREVVRHLPGTPSHRNGGARACIAGPQRRTVDDSLAKLRRVHYAWNTPPLFAPGDAELDLLASALAQQGTGRLYKTLVLEKRWARNVAAFQESRQLSSIFHVFADLQDDAPLDEVEKVIDEEVERMDEDADGAAELHRGVVAFESQYVWGLESVLSRAENLQNCNHFTGDPDCITATSTATARRRPPRCRRWREVPAEERARRGADGAAAAPPTEAPRRRTHLGRSATAARQRLARLRGSGDGCHGSAWRGRTAPATTAGAASAAAGSGGAKAPQSRRRCSRKSPSAPSSRAAAAAKTAGAARHRALPARRRHRRLPRRAPSASDRSPRPRLPRRRHQRPRGKAGAPRSA
jgi:hypothetical protein